MPDTGRARCLDELFVRRLAVVRPAERDLL